MYTKQYLTYGGLIFIVAGIFGLIGVLGPGMDNSIFTSAWFFNTGDAWAIIAAGVIALISAFSLEDEARRWFASIIGGLSIIIGLLGFIIPSSLATFGLPSGNVIAKLFYLVMGAWGLWAGLTRSTEVPAA